jgi:hypothetical protein
MPRALLVALFLSPAVARAQPTAALRLSFAPALGDLSRGVPMSDAMGSQLPVQLDGLWRLGPASVGVYASWGLGFVSDGACGSGADCSASGIRVGVQGLWAFAPLGAARVVPWGGLGLGWEWAFQERERLGSRTSWRWSGPELALQGGAEWPLAGRFGLGPFAQIALGRYGTVALDTSAGSASADLDTRAVHAWIQVGVRGRIDL